MSNSIIHQPTCISALSIISLLGFLIYLIVRLHLIYFYGLSIGGLENNVIYGVQKLMLGKPLYHNPALPPFDLIQKSPAYYFLVAKGASLLGFSAADPISIFRLSRWVSLLLNLGTASLMALCLVKNFKVNKLLAAALASLFIMNFTDHYFSRMDALYIFGFVLVTYLLLKELSTNRETIFFWIGALICFLFFSKQNGAVLVPVVGLLLLWHRRFKAIIWCVTGGMLTLLFGWWIFDLRWDTFYQNVFLGIKNGINWYNWKRLLQSEVHMTWFLVCLSALWLTIKFPQRQAKYITYLGIFFLIFGLVSVLKVASGINYFTELKFFAILCIGWLSSHAKTNREQWYPIILTSLIMGLSFVINIKDFSLNIGRLYLHKPTQYEQARQLTSWINANLPLDEKSYIYLGEEDFITHFLPDKVLLPIRSTPHEIIKMNTPAINYSLLYQQMDRGLITYVISKKKNLEEIKCLNRNFTNFNYMEAQFGYHIYQLQPSFPSTR